MAKTLETITLYFKEGYSDKFYIASIEESGGKHSVPVNWGRRGASGQFGYKAQGVSYGDAKKAYDRVVKEKTGKGYHTDGSTVSISVKEADYEVVPGIHTVPGSIDESLDDLDKVWESKRKIDWEDTEPAPSGVSSGLLPQLLNEIDEEEVGKYINDPAYCAQEKHDGRRRMLRCGSGKVEGINKKGQIVGYPGVFEGACKSIAEVNGLHSFTMDGEEVGEVCYVFDLLSLKGEDLRGLSYRVRHKRLLSLTIPSDSIRMVETAYTTKEKRSLYERLKVEGREGIVFKLLDGVHKVGYSDEQKKFKFISTASVIVTGHNKKNSISVGVMDGDKLVPVGNVTMIGHEKSPIGSICEVKYLYFFPGGSLFQPRYADLRDDMDKADCQLSKLKCKAIVDVDDKG